MNLFKAAMLGGVVCATLILPVNAQQFSGSCFAVSDSAIGEAGNTGDALFSVDIGDFLNTSTDLGSTGTNLTEGIEYITHRDKLYYGNGTEIWVAEGPNYNAPVLCDEVSGVTDIDGMTYDPVNEIFYIVDRNGTGSPGGGAGGAGAPEDELLALSIDNQCNVAITAGPFNIETAMETGVADVDDIALDPMTGKLYGVANNSNSSDTFLIEIDPTDGGLINAVQMDMPYPSYDDVEGMTFTLDGDLLVITGESAGQTSNGEGPNSSEIYSVDIVSGIGSLVGDLNAAASSDRSDFESLTCGQPELCSETHSISGFIFNEDAIAPNGLAGVQVKLRDANLDLVGFATTNDQGVFKFDNLDPGSYSYDVNELSVPAGLIATSSSSGLPVETVLGCAPIAVEIPYRNQVEGVIGDFVWHDYCTPDGIPDATELNLGLEGALLRINFGGNEVATSKTDSFGNYLVDGLTAGDYTVEMDLSDPIVEAFIDIQLGQQIQSSPSCPIADKVDIDRQELFADTTTPTSISGVLPDGGANLDFDYALIESTLDLSLNEFNLHPGVGQITFEWSTSSEVGFSGFELELKSSDDEEFNTITFVNAIGGDRLESFYSYEAAGLFVGKYLARLKMIDTDGTFTYSETIEAEISEWADIISIYPNPASANSKLKIRGIAEGGLNVEIYDQLGRKIDTLYEGQVRRDQLVDLNLDLAHLAPGLYVIEARHDDRSSQKSIVISR